jgi:hypothetical protein
VVYERWSVTLFLEVRAPESTSELRGADVGSPEPILKSQKLFGARLCLHCGTKMDRYGEAG